VDVRPLVFSKRWISHSKGNATVQQTNNFKTCLILCLVFLIACISGPHAWICPWYDPVTPSGPYGQSKTVPVLKHHAIVT